MADQDSRAGVSYIDTAILDYTNRLHAGHDQVLERAFRAPESHGMPAIQVGMSEGRLLELLTSMAQVSRAVEIGTLAGYSAIRIGRGLAAGGKLWTLELEPGHADVARDNIAFAGLSQQIEVRVGDAKSLLRDLEAEGPFDLVFIDADKESYDFYGEWALANLRPGGLIIGDNAFLFGELMNDTRRGQAMRRFHETVAQSFDSVCIPTPDGMLLGRKR